MKTAPFEYHAPRSVEEVVALLAEHGDEAKILAGGQSLMPLLAMRLSRPEHLIDINDVDSLAGISASADGLAIGALTRERDAERSSLVAERSSVLAEALPLIGHVTIRNRGTIGGSITHADASAELPAVAVVTGAELVLRSARGDRVVPAADFFDGHFTTTMEDDELLVEVRVPSGPAGAGWAFYEIVQRHGDFALVGVAAMVALDEDRRIRETRLCLIGVADRAVRAPVAEASLTGQMPTVDAFTAAAADAARDLAPASDMHGSAEFRRHLAGVAVRRALTTAAERAGATS
jgi:carbon-monoxide dehydrogenase medium subunit